METINQLEKVKALLYAISLFLFPIMLLTGFLMHDNIASLKNMTTAEELASSFRNNTYYHLGHLIVTLSIPLIILTFICFMERLKQEGTWFGLGGGVIGIIGSVILAVDKGSLCLVLSAFDTLPDAQFNLLIPFLQVIVDKKGLLIINHMLPLLTIGAIIQTIGLIKESIVSKLQGFLIILGLFLLNNPDIEIFSIMGTFLMILGYTPLATKILRRTGDV